MSTTTLLAGLILAILIATQLPGLGLWIGGM
jgi:hypothetical protein